MNRVELKHVVVRPPNPFARWLLKLHWALLALFVAAVLLACIRLSSPHPPFGGARWPDGLLLVLGVGTTLASLTRQLPAQNVILVAVAIGAAAAAVAVLGGFTGIPFGPIVYQPENVGRLLFYPLPWTVPLMWILGILNSRGVARLILRPYRGRLYYGFWVMGLTVLLVVILECSFEPYATLLKQYWSWKSTRISSTWYSTPWVNFLGWAMTTALILLFVTPALINKSPARFPPAYHALFVWEMLSFLFFLGVALRGYRIVTIFTSTQMIVVALLSVLGALTRPRAHQASNLPRE